MRGPGRGDAQAVKDREKLTTRLPQQSRSGKKAPNELSFATKM